MKQILQNLKTGETEVVAVPKHLCTKVPETVGDDAAAFTVLAAIALQGVRLAQPTLGAAVVAIG